MSDHVRDQINWDDLWELFKKLEQQRNGWNTGTDSANITEDAASAEKQLSPEEAYNRAMRGI